MSNHLIGEKSPYLRQHADNPVDWYPWGEQAFARALSEDKPVFLSVGYSTCHWCHVMARESFEDPAVAATLNASFICVKVDREERPDIDQVYMSAVQSVSGRGGWPMSAFLLPDGRPFYGGTYFPREQFRKLLMQIARMYREDRGRLEKAAAEVTQAVAAMSEIPRRTEADGAASSMGERVVRRTLQVLHRSFDAAHGGFAGAPKFPPHGALALLLHEYPRTNEEGLLRMAIATLDAMALGGIHDHVGGGFHRYATDERWLVPHFEKMLYDNALLARRYAEAFAITRDPFYREVAERVYCWAEREMTGPEGEFYSALDAESEGVEGAFYVWRKDEIVSVLGEEEGALFCRSYSVRPEGNYADEATGGRTGENILHLSGRGIQGSSSQGSGDLAAMRVRLLRAREQRPRPGRDEKVITSWNGLMIGSLAHAGRVFQDQRYTAMAEKAARFVLRHLLAGRRLFRRWCEGEAKHAGCLDDYTYLATGLLELWEATGTEEWLAQAREVTEIAIEEFWDQEGDAFFYTGEQSEHLFARPKDALDHPLPSGNGTAALLLLRLSEITGDRRYHDYAKRTLEAMSPWMERGPFGAETLALAAAQPGESERRQRRSSQPPT